MHRRKRQRASRFQPYQNQSPSYLSEKKIGNLNEYSSNTQIQRSSFYTRSLCSYSASLNGHLKHPVVRIPLSSQPRNSYKRVPQTGSTIFPAKVMSAVSFPFSSSRKPSLPNTVSKPEIPTKLSDLVIAGLPTPQELGLGISTNKPEVGISTHKPEVGISTYKPEVDIKQEVLWLEQEITPDDENDLDSEEGEWHAEPTEELSPNSGNVTPSKKVVHDLTSPRKKKPVALSDEKAESLLRAVINLTDEDEHQASSPWTTSASSTNASPSLPTKPVGWFEETNPEVLKLQSGPSVSPSSPASPVPLIPDKPIKKAKRLHRRIGPVEYKTARTPEERALLFAIVAAVKKLLRKKSLSKDMFKFICKHASGNVFTRLCDKQRISRPEKLVQSRLKKIKQLVDAECKRVVRDP